MSDDRASRIAAHLHSENAQKATFQWLTGPLAPSDMQEAYRAQSALHDLWRARDGRKLIGWKIAVTSKAMQELSGIDQPCVGAMFDSHVLESPAKVRLSDFVRLGLEFELAARIGQDMTDGPYDAVSAKAAVAAVAPCFELIEDRGADYAGFEAKSLIADNTWNGGVVLGPEIPGWEQVDWTAAPVTLNYNDSVERAHTGEAMGDPFNSLAAVANNLLERGLHLRAGEIVITGSTVKTRFAAIGDVARYAIDGLGAVEIEIVA